jgi:2-keto-4-pentenoate hydratase/2-oxohepta-3-ene-1,7-dioic acid hydratase in catechol pathway
MRIYRVDLPNGPCFARDAGGEDLVLLDNAPWLGGQTTGQQLSLNSVRLLAPVQPSKIVCVGRNYRAHAKELGNEVPSEPLLFLKPPSALSAPGGVIQLPKASQRVEHEGEIGVVIGSRLRNVDAEQALRGIFGITAVNDVTARDIQKREVQFTRAKGFDTFCPVGPCVVTGLDVERLSVICRVNGQERQHGEVGQMVFGIAALLSFISSVMTLEPGDLIATGTPEGVGALATGDTVEVEVPDVGVLRSTVV